MICIALLAVIYVPGVHADQKWTNQYPVSGQPGYCGLTTKIANIQGNPNAKVSNCGALTSKQEDLTAAAGSLTTSATILMDDASFFVPNLGQSTTALTVSGAFHVYMYFDNDVTIGFFAGAGDASGSVTVTVNIWHDLSTPVLALTFTEQTFQAASCNISGIVLGVCHNTQAYNGDYAFSHSVALNGYGNFHVEMSTVITSSSSVVGTAFSDACINYTADPANCYYPAILNPSSTCPTGFSGSDCDYWLQWKSTSYDLVVPDFAVTASPNFEVLNAGSSTLSTIILSSIAGFATSVSLSATSNDPNFVLSTNPSRATLSSGGSATATLTISDPNTCDSGTYIVTVTGTATDASGANTFSHSTTISVSVNRICDFTLSANPTSLSIHHGKKGSSVITLSSTNGFSGNVGLTSTISPVLTSGSASMSPPTVTLSAGSATSSTLTVSTAKSTSLGPYTVTIIATSGMISHSVTISLTVT